MSSEAHGPRGTLSLPLSLRSIPASASYTHVYATAIRLGAILFLLSPHFITKVAQNFNDPTLSLPPWPGDFARRSCVRRRASSYNTFGAFPHTLGYMFVWSGLVRNVGSNMVSNYLNRCYTTLFRKKI